MKTILSALAVLAALAFLPAAGAQPKITTAASSAKAPLLIPYRPGGIRIDGQGTDEVWKQIPPLTSFRYYWDPEEPPRTELRLFHDGENLYFLYTVEDPDILRHPVIGEEMEIASEDRIEFGFSPEDPAVPYYFFEIDSAGRVLDYESRFYRQFDPQWDSLSLEVKTAMRSKGNSRSRNCAISAFSGPTAKCCSAVSAASTKTAKTPKRTTSGSAGSIRKPPSPTSTFTARSVPPSSKRLSPPPASGIS